MAALTASVTLCFFPLLSVGFVPACMCWEVKGGPEDWNLGNVTCTHLTRINLVC